MLVFLFMSTICTMNSKSDVDCLVCCLIPLLYYTGLFINYADFTCFHCKIPGKEQLIVKPFRLIVLFTQCLILSIALWQDILSFPVYVKNNKSVVVLNITVTTGFILLIITLQIFSTELTVLHFNGLIALKNNSLYFGVESMVERRVVHNRKALIAMNICQVLLLIFGIVKDESTNVFVSILRLLSCQICFCIPFIVEFKFFVLLSLYKKYYRMTYNAIIKLLNKAENKDQHFYSNLIKLRQLYHCVFINFKLMAEYLKLNLLILGSTLVVLLISCLYVFLIIDKFGLNFYEGAFITISIFQFIGGAASCVAASQVDYVVRT